MTTVVFDGILGKKFGEKWENIHCNTPKKALQIISANVDGLYEFIRKNINTYAGYAVIVDGKEYDSNDYLLDRSKKQPKTIRFVPLVAGAGGFFRSIFGRVVMAVAICVAAYFTAGAAAGAMAQVAASAPEMASLTPAVQGAIIDTLATTGNTSAAASAAFSAAGANASFMAPAINAVLNSAANATIGAGFAAGSVSAGASLAMSIGTSMLLGAAVGLLTKQAKMANKDFENSSDKTSHYFDGAVNTERQGVAIPLIYGTVLTGSHPISVNLQVMDTTE